GDIHLSASLGQAGNGNFELLIGGGGLAFQLVQFRVAKDLPPIALGELGLWLGDFPTVRRARVRSDNVRCASVGFRNGGRRRPFVIRSDGAAGDHRQGG